MKDFNVETYVFLSVNVEIYVLLSVLRIDNSDDLSIYHMNAVLQREREIYFLIGDWKISVSGNSDGEDFPFFYHRDSVQLPPIPATCPYSMRPPRSYPQGLKHFRDLVQVAGNHLVQVAGFKGGRDLREGVT